MSGDNSQVLTGAADNSARLWDCQTGKEVGKFDTNSAVRTCGFSHLGKYLMYSTDATMNNMCEIHLFDVRDHESLIRLVRHLSVETEILLCHCGGVVAQTCSRAPPLWLISCTYRVTGSCSCHLTLY